MMRALLPMLPILLAAPAMGQDVRGLDGVELAQMTIRERIIIRVPRMVPRTLTVAPTRRMTPLPVPLVEKRGPKCIALQSLRGAAISASNSIDLVVEGGARVRAKLDDDCPALDFYSGFYMRRTADGQICADRDAIRSRAGAACAIETFKLLVPKH